ncbi:MCM DNA helicase complex subunit mcm6, partial [Ceratobasidium sp. 395]
FTPEAADLLVEKYRLLRQSDATGVGKNSYRITIVPAFVNEAYSLLKSSIIHVEQDDIDFDDADLDMDVDAAAAAADAAEAADSSLANGTTDESLAMPSSPIPHQNGSTPHQLAATPQPQTQPQQQKRKMRITHDKYTTMQELIVLHVASVEQATGTGVEGNDLVDWYLESKEDEFGSMEEMEEERELLGKVLKKLVKDRYLMIIYGDTQDSMLDTSESMETDATDVNANKKVFYHVHPEVDNSSSSVLG